MMESATAAAENILLMNPVAIVCYLCEQVLENEEKACLLFEKQNVILGQNCTCVRSISQVLSAVLMQSIEPDDAHSNVLCQSCVELLEQFERLERKLESVRFEIVTTYNRTAHIYNLKPVDIASAPFLEGGNGGDGGGIIQQTSETSNDAAADVEQQQQQQNDEILLNADSIDVTDGDVIGGEYTFIEQDVGDLIEDQTDGGGLITTKTSLQKQKLDENNLGFLNINKANATDNNCIDVEELRSNEENADSKYVRFIHANNLNDLADMDIHAEDVIIYEQNSDVAKALANNAESDSMDQYIFYTESGSEHSQDCPELQATSENHQATIITHTDEDGQVDVDVDEDENDIENDSLLQEAELEQKLQAAAIQEGEGSYLCLMCKSSRSMNTEEYAEHLKSEHKLSLFQCAVCSIGFDQRKELTAHFESVHGVKESEVLECELCRLQFPTLRLLRMHKRKHYKSLQAQYECQDCSKKYPSETLLYEHMNMHIGLRPYKCDQCSKDFASKSTLQNHLKIHTERVRPFQCDQCNKTFLSQPNLVHHQRVHTNKKDYVCKDCNKAFASQHNLDVHGIVHSGMKPFICRHCGKSFARRAEVRDHERIHSGDKPFRCDLCSAAFTQRSNLVTHKKSTHFNEKSHTCTICDRAFKRRRLLDYHMQAVHTGERPHKCDTCGASFVYPEHFKKHLRIHSGDKPFACEVCGKRFNSRDNRNAHRFVHSDKKPYECITCSMGFMRKPQLFAHMSAVGHNNSTFIVNTPQIPSTLSQNHDTKPNTFTMQRIALSADSVQDSNSLLDDTSQSNDDNTAESLEEFIVKCEEDGEIEQDSQSETQNNQKSFIILADDLNMIAQISNDVDDDDDDNDNGVDDDNRNSANRIAASLIIKEEDLGDVRYLEFDDLEKNDDNSQALSWVEMTSDKE